MSQLRVTRSGIHRFTPSSIRPSRTAGLAALAFVWLLVFAFSAGADGLSEAVTPELASAPEPAVLATAKEGCDGDAAAISGEEFLQRSLTQGLDRKHVDMSSGSSGSVPSCPIQSCRCSNCQQPVFCPVGACQDQDTGLQACSVGNIAISCPAHQTVHLRNAPCGLPDGQSCGPFNYCGSATISGSCQ